MPAAVEAAVLELGGRGRIGVHGGWCSSWPNARWCLFRRESAVYRALVRAGMIDPAVRDRFTEVETLGTRGADGVVADGYRRWFPVG